jgi:uncharacterized protein YbaR (Trm112 family)
MPVPDDLLAILRCLECRSPLRQEEAVLVCGGCGLHYPVDGDVPVMLIESAYRPEAPKGH